MDRQAISDGLGMLSILTWLGAQSPQIYENWRNKSVEGLALPFLVSWFAGDFTNFLGCILTGQLPFQTYLAGYFLIVDVILCSQFAYYSRTSLPPLSEDFPYAQPPTHASSPHLHHRRSRSRKRKSRSSRGASGKDTPPYIPAGEDDPMRSSWMSESSSAAPSTQTSPRFSQRTLPSRSSSATQTVPPSPTAPERGRTLTRSAYHHPSFDPSLSTIYGSPSTNGAFMSHHQHLHSLTTSSSHVSFDPHPDEVLGEETRERRQRTSSSRSRPPPPSRRSTSVVFLSVGALVTFGSGAFSGSATGGGTIGPMKRAEAGRAWSTGAVELEKETKPSFLRHPAFFSTSSWPSASPLDLVLLHSRHARRATTLPLNTSDSPLSASSPSSFPLFSDSSPSPGFQQGDDTFPGDSDGDDNPLPPPRGVDWERVIGRVSAWACTAFYLTSRLPQLWQNFRRRSCEGLAMTLFLFAFIGNSLYVLSILLNPLSSTSPGYLLESTPYLLGSGGTLCFDLAILFQAWIYSEKRKGRRERERRRRGMGGVEAAEEEALLDGDLEGEADGGGETDDGGTLRASKRRAGSKVPRSRSSTRSFSTTGGGGGVAGNSKSKSRSRVGGGRRSDSTEMGSSSASTSRAERGLLHDEPFDFSTPRAGGGRSLSRGGGSGSSTPVGEGSLSRGSSRMRTTSAPGSVLAESIPEEGESTVTLR